LHLVVALPRPSGTGGDLPDLAVPGSSTQGTSSHLTPTRWHNSLRVAQQGNHTGSSSKSLGGPCRVPLLSLGLWKHASLSCLTMSLGWRMNKEFAIFKRSRVWALPLSRVRNIHCFGPMYSEQRVTQYAMRRKRFSHGPQVLPNSRGPSIGDKRLEDNMRVDIVDLFCNSSAAILNLANSFPCSWNDSDPLKAQAIPNPQASRIVGVYKVEDTPSESQPTCIPLECATQQRP